MARYIVVHGLAENYTGQSSDDVEQLRHHLYDLVKGTPVQWIRGWWLYGSSQQLCEYESPSEDAIRAAIERSGISQMFPIASVQEAMPNGPGDIPGEFA
jgi:hypothetical protein